MDNKTVLSDSYFKDAIPRREQWPTPGQIREYEQSYGIKYEPMSLPTEQHSKPEPEMKPERTKEEILTELIRAINPKWDYGKDDEEVFRSFWYFFNPEPARTIILKAMEEYRQSSPVESTKEEIRLKSRLSAAHKGAEIRIQELTEANETLKKYNDEILMRCIGLEERNKELESIYKSPVESKWVRDLREALTDLTDIQNGPPLVRDTDAWNEIMERCYKVLEETKEK